MLSYDFFSFFFLAPHLSPKYPVPQGISKSASQMWIPSLWNGSTQNILMAFLLDTLLDTKPVCPILILWKFCLLFCLLFLFCFLLTCNLNVIRELNSLSQCSGISYKLLKHMFVIKYGAFAHYNLPFQCKMCVL